MADIAKLSTGIRPADIPERQHTAQLAETCANGDLVRFDLTNGTITGANGSAAGEAGGADGLGPIGILLEGGIAGEWRTFIERGKVAGFNVSGLNFGAPVYASNTDKTLGDAAGTFSRIVGRVIPATANGTQPYDKIVQVG